MNLKSGHSGQGSGRRPNLGGEVGESGEVVAEGRRRISETSTGQLHAVTGITGKTDNHALTENAIG
jgi:hypothetical protein